LRRAKSLARIALPFLAAWSLACSGKPQTEVHFECPSPDARSVAYFYREFGGRGTGWEYQRVSVESEGTTNVVFSTRSGHDARLTWLAPRRLRISYPDTARVDHWQSWFGIDAKGVVEIEALASEDGHLSGTEPGCGASRRDSYR
jgi:hypothetical protein